MEMRLVKEGGIREMERSIQFFKRIWSGTEIEYCGGSIGGEGKEIAKIN